MSCYCGVTVPLLLFVTMLSKPFIIAVPATVLIVYYTSSELHYTPGVVPLVSVCAF